MTLTDHHPGTTPATGHDELRLLYASEYRSLVKLASLLLDDPGACEEVVQDAFVRTLVAWASVRDRERAPAFLRSAVLNGARSRLRRSLVARRHPPRPSDDVVATDVAAVDHAVVNDELRKLPVRQREAVALRFYLDMSESEIADAMGVSTGSVKTHLHRGLRTLSTRLEAR